MKTIMEAGPQDRLQFAGAGRGVLSTSSTSKRYDCHGAVRVPSTNRMAVLQTGACLAMQPVLRVVAAGVVLLSISAGFAADQADTNAPAEHLLLKGALGRLVVVPTNEVPQALLP